MLTIGSYKLDTPIILAPMAGVTDRPFRQLCIRHGAGLAVSEMVTSDTRLWNSRKTRTRLDHNGEAGLRSVQIAGADPVMMAEAARKNVELGAQIIDINMGCPAKKVCSKAAGSALMRDEKLVSDILDSVVSAVSVPVTLKIRTGWSPEQRNGVQVARIAEQAGIQALAVHGRTRSCMYKGEAEYETIAEIKSTVSIPVIANGDIDSPLKARSVFEQTGVDGIMIGRAAQGRPWIFREIKHFLETGETLEPPQLSEVRNILLEHLEQLHLLYGEFTGIRIARKHVGWYLQANNCGQLFRKVFNQLDSVTAQRAGIKQHFERLLNGEEFAA